jgi:hypothetical protein
MINLPRIEYIDSQIEFVNKYKFFTSDEITLQASVNNILEICKENEIDESHIIIFSAFLQMLLGTPADGSQKLLSHFVKIPKKKLKNYHSANTKEWIFRHLSKMFFQPITKMNIKDEEKFDFPNLCVYHFMAYFLVKKYTETNSEDDIIEKFSIYLHHKAYSDLASFMLGVLFTHSDTDLFDALMEQINKNNIFHAFIYHLNVEIERSCVFLLKYGKKTTFISLGEEAYQLADDTINEALTNVIKERDEYMQVIQEYNHKIALLENELGQYKEKYHNLQVEYSRLKNNPVLSQLKVLVIGDTRRREGYKRLVEKYGGEFNFIDGIEEDTKARQSSLKVDLVFHIISYSSHVVYEQIKDLSHIIYVNNAGLASLENAIKEIQG